MKKTAFRTMNSLPRIQTKTGMPFQQMKSSNISKYAKMG